MSVIKVNPLPSKTWHWLRMNDSNLKFELPDVCAVRELSGTDGPCVFSFNPKREEMETGMGTEFSAMMADSKGVALEIPADTAATQTALVTCGAGAGMITIHAQPRSVLSALVLLSGEDDNPAALQIQIHAEADAHVELCLVQLRRGITMTDVGAVCDARANLKIRELHLGGAQQFTGMAVRLSGEESCVTTDMAYRVLPGQNLDINYVTRHIGRETVSEMNAHAVLEETARKLFRGTIDFPTGCAGAVGSEKEEVLMLGSRQVNQTIPLILCQEEDVEGSHGATISRLDEQMLFYLGSRGVNTATAEEMIARARLETVCAMIPVPFVRDIAEQRICQTGKGENVNVEF